MPKPPIACLALLLVASGSVTACAGGAAPCPVLDPGAPQGSLAIHEAHEFGRLYEVFEATYFIDDCVLSQTNDTAVLRRADVEYPPRALAAGNHSLRFAFKLRADFDSNMQGWEWYYRGQVAFLVPESGAVRANVRMFEEGEGNPRKRLKVALSFE